MSNPKRTQVNQQLFNNDGSLSTTNVLLTSRILEMHCDFRGILPEAIIEIAQKVANNLLIGDTHLGIFRGEERSVPFDIYIYISQVPMRWVNVPDNYKKHIKELQEIYVFDRNTHTHLCSLTPSYQLERISQNVDFNNYNLMSRELIEEIDDWWRDACRESDDTDYISASKIDNLIKTESQYVKRYGIPVGYEEEYDETWDDCIDDIRSNTLWDYTEII